MIKILSQQVCPKCDQLFTYLKYGLQDKYSDKIEVIKKEDQSEQFYQLAQRFDVQSTPAIIVGEAILRDCTPLKVAEFLKQHVG